MIAGFDSRPPTQEELDNVNLVHVELTSDVEWIPHSFTLLLAEEDVVNSDDEERISNLRARCLRKALDSKSTKARIKSCLSILAAMQFPFELQIADEVKMPVLRRIAALTVADNTEEQQSSTQFPKSGFVNPSLSVDLFYVNSVGNCR